MKTYQLIELKKEHPAIYCSDPKIFDQIFTDLRAKISTAETKDWGNGFIRFHKLQNKDAQIVIWLFQWVLERGFEPYTVYTYAGSEGATSTVNHCFRRVIEK